MSSFDIGSVRSEIDNEYTDLQVGWGHGWGGDGENYHTAYLEYNDTEGDLHMMHLTTSNLRKLVHLLEIALARAEIEEAKE